MGIPWKNNPYSQSDTVHKWFLNMLNMNLNTEISVQTSSSENKYEHAFEYNNKMFSKIQGSINNMKVRLTKQNKLLLNLVKLVCDENQKIYLSSKMINIKLSYLDFIKTVKSQISEAQYGTVHSQELNYVHFALSVKPEVFST